MGADTCSAISHLSAALHERDEVIARGQLHNLHHKSVRVQRAQALHDLACPLVKLACTLTSGATVRQVDGGPGWNAHAGHPETVILMGPSMLRRKHETATLWLLTLH